MIYFVYFLRKLKNSSLPIKFIVYKLRKLGNFFFDAFRFFYSSVPIEDGPIDDYVLATQASENDCNSSYSKRCQFSILGFLISKDRRIL